MQIVFGTHGSSLRVVASRWMMMTDTKFSDNRSLFLAFAKSACLMCLNSTMHNSVCHGALCVDLSTV